VTTDAQPPEFDTGNWVWMARFAAAAAMLLSIITAAILLMADPPKQCANWRLNDVHSTPLWELWVACVLVFLVPACFIALRWNWVVQSAVKQQKRKFLIERLFGPMTPPPIPVTYVLVILCIAVSLVSQFPLFALVTKCTDWLRL
jgi:hypothetical protein